MLISAITGSENFPIGMSKHHLFAVGTRRLPGGEVFISQAMKEPSRNIAKHGASTTLPAAPGMKPELGSWTQGTYDVPEGQVLKVYYQRKSSGVSQPTQGSMYVQARANAALRRVIFPTLAWDRGQYSSVHVEGRFDILTEDQLRVLGHTVPTQFARLMETQGKLRLLRVEEVSPEIVQRVEPAANVVVNSQGEEVAVPVNRRRRNMDL